MGNIKSSGIQHFVWYSHIYISQRPYIITHFGCHIRIPHMWQIEKVHQGFIEIRMKHYLELWEYKQKCRAEIKCSCIKVYLQSLYGNLWTELQRLIFYQVFISACDSLRPLSFICFYVNVLKRNGGWVQCLLGHGGTDSNWWNRDTDGKIQT